jgi:hypothetical protein
VGICLSPVSLTRARTLSIPSAAVALPLVEGGRLPGGWGRDGVARLRTLARKRRREDGGEEKKDKKNIGRFDM